MTTHQTTGTKLEKPLNITYSARYLKCKSAKCLICLTGKGHGPYWYASFLYQGKNHNIFIGNEFKPLDVDAVLERLEQDRRRQEAARQKAERRRTAKTNFRKFQFKDAGTVSDDSEKFWVNGGLSQSEFNSDILKLSRVQQPESLKMVYRQLIKKYHPDQYQGNSRMNQWMAEINELYQTQRLKFRSAV